jgi:catalase
MEPVAGLAHLSEEDAKGKDGDYLVKEIAERVENGGVKFTVKAQLADPDDVVDDATIHWPEEREVVTLGTIALEAMVADQAAEQKQIIFDPIPRVEGIEPSDDPLLELRAAVYLISGRRRRKA